VIAGLVEQYVKSHRTPLPAVAQASAMAGRRCPKGLQRTNYFLPFALMIKSKVQFA